VLRARLDSFDRVAHLRPFALPGGEAAIREPGRVALAVLLQAAGEEVLADPDLPALLGLPARAVRPLARMIQRGVNCPVTTSMGRLFDAVAALALGAGRVSYEGEAAAWLESAAERGESQGYTLPLTPEREGDWRAPVRAVLADRKAGVAGGTIAGRFHEAVIAWAVAVASRFGGLPVVLGGGCFQNARLAEGLVSRLRRAGREVYLAGAIPPGDGGLAVGQLAVALAWRAKSAN
jgi:hydrogenase maturation protein HypF